MEKLDERCKGAINRRPAGYWKVFSLWWRSRYAALGDSRPTVNEVIDWYHQNADASWPAGQVPSLKAVLRQSKGLRPIDGLKEYFREYRKKRKQQGGQPLTAGDGALRRSKAARRRNTRNAHTDSTDEEAEEEEIEDAMEADIAENPSNSSDEFEEAEVTTPARTRRQQRGAQNKKAADAEAGAAPACTAQPCAVPLVEPKPSDQDPSTMVPGSGITCAVATSSDGSHPASPNTDVGTSGMVERACGAAEAEAALQAVFAAWHPAGVDAVAATAATAAPPPPPPVNWLGGRAVDVRTLRGQALLPCGASGTDSSATDVVALPASASFVDQSHTHAAGVQAAFTFAPAVPQCGLLPAVPVRRAPRTMASLRGCVAPCLPPLSSTRRAPAVAAFAGVRSPFAFPCGVGVACSPFAIRIPINVQEAADDVCSTGGSVSPFAPINIHRLQARSFQHPHPRDQPFYCGPHLHGQYSGQPLCCDGGAFPACADGSRAVCIGTRRSSSTAPWPPAPVMEPCFNHHACAVPHSHCAPYEPCFPQQHLVAPGCGDHLQLPSTSAYGARGVAQHIGAYACAEEGSACSSGAFPIGQPCPSGGPCSGPWRDQHMEERSVPVAPAVTDEAQLFGTWGDSRPLGMTTAGSLSSMTNAMPPAACAPSFPPLMAAREETGACKPLTSMPCIVEEQDELCYLPADVEQCVLGVGPGNDDCSSAFDQDLAAAFECFVAGSSAPEMALAF